MSKIDKVLSVVSPGCSDELEGVEVPDDAFLSSLRRDVALSVAAIALVCGGALAVLPNSNRPLTEVGASSAVAGIPSGTLDVMDAGSIALSESGDDVDAR